MTDHTFTSAHAAILSAEQFDRVVDEAIARLPDWVREAFDNLLFVVEDRADEELDPDGDGLLGLYVGTPLTERSVEDSGVLPDTIYLFRESHLAMNLGHDELRDEICKTLIHEIAHYFGIDDDHLHDIGWG